MRSSAVALLLALFAAAGVARAQSLLCAADLDGDAAADQPAEQALCAQLAGGPLCPLQRQACLQLGGSAPQVATPVAVVALRPERERQPTGPLRLPAVIATEPTGVVGDVRIAAQVPVLSVDRFVTLYTADGDAQAGADYEPSNTRIAVLAGEGLAPFTLALRADAEAELPEWFWVVATDDADPQGSITWNRVTIVDATPKPLPGGGLYVPSAVAMSASNGRRLQTLTLDLDAPASVAVQVRYATRDGSARAGLDYESAAGVVSFAPGVVRQSLEIVLLDRADAEEATGFFVDFTALPSPEAFSCPLDPGLACVQDGDGGAYCSPHACFLRSAVLPETLTPPVSAGRDNGPRDADGRCVGDLQIFAGESTRCRRSGVQTLFSNCCANHGDVIRDSGGGLGSIGMKLKVVGTVGQAAAIAATSGLEAANAFLMSSFNPTMMAIGLAMGVLMDMVLQGCDQRDMETALLKDSGYCVSVGSYCAERWPLVGCVQRAESHCCFNSKLARIVQEQGRRQIPAMGGFGEPRAPNCRGFRPEEFQAIDFSKIDLSEYFDELQVRSQALIEGEIRTRVETRF